MVQDQPGEFRLEKTTNSNDYSWGCGLQMGGYNA